MSQLLDLSQPNIAIDFLIKLKSQLDGLYFIHDEAQKSSEKSDEIHNNMFKFHASHIDLLSCVDSLIEEMQEKIERENLDEYLGANFAPPIHQQRNV